MRVLYCDTVVLVLPVVVVLLVLLHTVCIIYVLLGTAETSSDFTSELEQGRYMKREYLWNEVIASIYEQKI